jgi:glutamine amidotransferase
MPNVVVIDYGMGNLLSVTRAFEYCGAAVIVTDSPTLIADAERVVLPGVGAFADGMKGLKKKKLIDAIKKFSSKNKPFLGICLGMQMMMDVSEEFGMHKGLGIVRGKVAIIPQVGSNGSFHKIPHIGWNGLRLPDSRKNWERTILEGIAPGEFVYFVHSYSVVPDNNVNELAQCQYNGLHLSAAINSGNLYGCQFHPEKSGEVGVKIIKNFLRL